MQPLQLNSTRLLILLFEKELMRPMTIEDMAHSIE
jgi:hypothetical protein